MARVGLGALGIITSVTLQCVDAFMLHAVERPEPLARRFWSPCLNASSRPTTLSFTGSRTRTWP